MNTAWNPREFRDALGSFATGVTVVTTVTPDGSPVGVTANSFSSLSLDPPLVLWALARSSLSLPAFGEARGFAIHVLAADQQALSERFARRGADKFADLEYDSSTFGTPMLGGCAARFECETAYRYDGGDHVIFVGRVVGFTTSGSPALAFVNGRYGNVIRERPAPGGPPNDVPVFHEEFLGFLLARANARIAGFVKTALANHRFDEEHSHVLLALSGGHAGTLSELDRSARALGRGVGFRTLADLALAGLVDVHGHDDPATRVSLTDRGRDVAVELSAVLKAVEAELEQRLGFAEARLLRALLRDVEHGTTLPVGGGEPDLEEW